MGPPGVPSLPMLDGACLTRAFLQLTARPHRAGPCQEWENAHTEGDSWAPNPGSPTTSISAVFGASTEDTRSLESEGLAGLQRTCKLPAPPEATHAAACLTLRGQGCKAICSQSPSPTFSVPHSPKI